MVRLGLRGLQRELEERADVRINQEQPRAGGVVQIGLARP